MTAFEYLFSPIQIGPLRLRNRIVSTAHAPALSEDGMPGERERLYFAEKAKGGAGLVMIGGSTSTHPRSPATEWAMIANRDDRIIPYYQQMADAIHGHGSTVITQLTHMGPRGTSDTEAWLALWAPTQIPEPLHREIMKLYASLGRRSEAASHYQMLVENLKDRGQTPSEETRQLYQELMS